MIFPKKKAFLKGRGILKNKMLTQELMQKVKKFKGNNNSKLHWHYNLLINVSTASEVDPSQGLRQWDPISPYLFVICLKILLRMLESETKVQRIKIDRITCDIDHMLYTNYLLLVGRATIQSGKAIRKCSKKKYYGLGSR